MKQYYDGGSQRCPSTFLLLSDYLGSTAYTVSGTSETGELRYKAFGAGALWARFTSGATPTTYRRVPPGRGQREEAGLGLYYFTDPSGHFTTVAQRSFSVAMDGAGPEICAAPGGWQIPTSPRFANLLAPGREVRYGYSPGLARLTADTMNGPELGR